MDGFPVTGPLSLHRRHVVEGFVQAMLTLVSRDTGRSPSLPVPLPVSRLVLLQSGLLLVVLSVITRLLVLVRRRGLRSVGLQQLTYAVGDGADVALTRGPAVGVGELARHCFRKRLQAGGGDVKFLLCQLT
jgi:hypothetical protein